VLGWGLAGALRGSRQPPAWPSGYALARWLLKGLAWCISLGVVAVIVVNAWRLGLGGGLAFEGLSLAAAALAGAALGFIPATLDELAHSRHAVDQEYVMGRRSSRRPILWAAGGLSLLLIALLAPRVITTTVNRSEVQAMTAPAKSWVEARMSELEDTLDGLTRDLTLRYYNKPAGGVGPTPTPVVSGSELLKTLSGQ
jgi:hypothetical protein